MVVNSKTLRKWGSRRPLRERQEDTAGFPPRDLCTVSPSSSFTWRAQPYAAPTIGLTLAWPGWQRIVNTFWWRRQRWRRPPGPGRKLRSFGCSREDIWGLAKKNSEAPCDLTTVLRTLQVRPRHVDRGERVPRPQIKQ